MLYYSFFKINKIQNGLNISRNVGLSCGCKIHGNGAFIVTLKNFYWQSEGKQRIIVSKIFFYHSRTLVFLENLRKGKIDPNNILSEWYHPNKNLLSKAYNILKLNNKNKSYLKQPIYLIHKFFINKNTKFQILQLIQFWILENLYENMFMSYNPFYKIYLNTILLNSVRKLLCKMCQEKKCNFLIEIKISNILNQTYFNQVIKDKIQNEEFLYLLKIHSYCYPDFNLNQKFLFNPENALGYILSNIYLSKIDTYIETLLKNNSKFEYLLLFNFSYICEKKFNFYIKYKYIYYVPKCSKTLKDLNIWKKIFKLNKTIFYLRYFNIIWLCCQNYINYIDILKDKLDQNFLKNQEINYIYNLHIMKKNFIKHNKTNFFETNKEINNLNNYFKYKILNCYIKKKQNIKINKKYIYPFCIRKILKLYKIKFNIFFYPYFFRKNYINKWKNKQPLIDLDILVKKKLEQKGFIKIGKKKSNNIKNYIIKKKNWIHLEYYQIIKKYKQTLKKMRKIYSSIYSTYIYWYLIKKKKNMFSQINIIKKNILDKKIKYILRNSCAKTLKTKYNISSKKQAFKLFGNFLK
jgi:hypothetical protein